MSGVREDNTYVGAGGYPGYGGGGGVFLVAILLIFVVLAVIWGGRGHDGPHHGGGYGGFIPGGFGCGFPGAGADLLTLTKYANYMDPQLAKLETEVACRTGSIEKQNAVDTGTIIHILDNQTCEIKEGLAAVINNQNQLAHQAEVMALNNKIADMRANENRLECRINQQETVGTIDRTNCQLNYRLDRIECEMAKRPPFFTAGAYPTGMPFGAFFGERGDRDDRGCCC